MKKGSVSALRGSLFVVLLTSSVWVGCGGGSSSGGGCNANPVVCQPLPGTPTGVTASAGNQQITLNWNASAGATSYNVGRSTANGGPYANAGSTSTTAFTDTGLTNGSTYYYVVSAKNSAGSSSNSSQVSATPTAPLTSIHVTVDTMTDRHFISPFVYGGAFPKDAATITDSGLTVVRWGGNATSTYNWKLGTYNADNDWYFEDFNFGALNNNADSDSVQFIGDVKAAGSHPLTTMVMMDWVAKAAETSANNNWSFPASAWPSQCGFDPYNLSAGNGLQSDCKTAVTNQAVTSAYYPLLDQPGSSDPTGSVYRSQWAAALASAFGSGPACPIPYSSVTSCHFYDMDNEVDIWGGTHFDIHPASSGYNELRDVYLAQARNLKTWDPQAVRLGPVSCCWWFYWNLNSTTDNKSAHAGIDFLPWWVNEIAWQDQIAGSRSLDLFDIHAYPDGPDLSGMTATQKRAAAVRIYRDYWDPTYTSEGWFNGNTSVTQIEPNPYVAFRIPRFRAIVNTAYPGTPLAITEWSAAFAGESDFSTALGDADAYGILGRERVSLSTRWVAADPANPNYQALKLFTNYDGSHQGFDNISVSATHDADPDLFSVYAATVSGGSSITLLVLNKDPNNAAQTSFGLNGFTPSQMTAYTLSQSAPNQIVAGASQAWSSRVTFAPYTATLLVITGTPANPPSAEWDLNPDTVMVPAGGTVVLHPHLVSGSGNLTLGSPSTDSGITATVTQSTISPAQSASVTVNAGTTPGFYHISVPASDGTTQGGWMVVGNPAATLNKTGDNQTGSVGTTLNLSVTLQPGQSGGTAAGASILLTTNAGSLTSGAKSGARLVAVTNASGVASVTLTLPGTAQQVQVQAEGPFALGHPVVTFTETAQ